MNGKEVIKQGLPLLVFFSNALISLQAETMSVEDALQHRLIQLQLSAKGGYQDDCVAAKIQNNTAGNLNILFEPGRILDNTNPTQQDIIVTQKMNLALGPNALMDTSIIGYCCQSHNSSPQKNQKFILGKMAAPNLVNLCNYISTRKLDNTSVQNAIWTLSNNHLLASIGMPGDTSIAALFAYCKKGSCQALPWYHLSYLYVPGKVFSNQPHKVHLNFSYEKKSDQELFIAVYDSSGNKIKTLLANSYANPGTREYHLTFDVLQWKHGNYTLKVMEREQEALVKTFEI
jgi:hypothetical protein